MILISAWGIFGLIVYFVVLIWIDSFILAISFIIVWILLLFAYDTRTELTISDARTTRNARLEFTGLVALLVILEIAKRV